MTLNFEQFMQTMFKPSQNFTPSGLRKMVQRHKLAHTTPAPDPQPLTRQVRRQNERLANKPRRF